MEKYIMAKIGLYINDLGIGGVTRYANNLYDGLRNYGHNCTIIANQDVKSEDRLISKENKCVEVLNENKKLKTLDSLRKIIKAKDFDIFICNGWFALFITSLAVKLLKKKPKIISVTHVRTSLWGTSKGNGFLRFLKTKLAQFGFNNADKLITVSRGMADELNEGDWSKQQFINIYNPVISEKITKFRVNNEFHNDKIELVGMGWLEPRKGFDTLIETTKDLKDNNINVNTTIIGGKHNSYPEHREYLYQLVKKYDLKNEVNFAGVINNPFPILAEKDIFVFPSRNETLGLALIEGMALGLPVIAADCEHGPAEILKHNKYGFLVEQDNPEEIVDSVIKLMNPDTYKKYTELSLERANDFKINKIAGIYNEIINEIL